MCAKGIAFDDVKLARCLSVWVVPPLQSRSLVTECASAQELACVELVCCKTVLSSLGNALQFMTVTHLLKRIARFSVLLPEMCRSKSPTDSLEILDYLRAAKLCQVSGLKPHPKLIKTRRKISLLSLSFDPGAQCFLPQAVADKKRI